ncbi:MAG: hypothetical protein WBM09_08235 [Gallionella sp.]
MAAGLIYAAVILPVHAEDLPDPTRPPSSIAAASGTGIGSVAPSSRLRSIIISETRRAAIIDGKTVELGERIGETRLVEINAGSVVLQRGNARQVLTLFPGVKIRNRETPDAGSTIMESQKKETQVEQQPASGVMSLDKHSKPAAHEERPLSGHPKEEK